MTAYHARLERALRESGRFDLLALYQGELQARESQSRLPPSSTEEGHLYLLPDWSECLDGESTTLVRTSISGLLASELEIGDEVFIEGLGRRRLHDVVPPRPAGDTVWLVLDHAG
jgi:hypothetical protein